MPYRKTHFSAMARHAVILLMILFPVVIHAAYPGPDQVTPFRVTIAGKDVSVKTLFQEPGFKYKKIPVSYAHATVNGPADVVIQTGEPITASQIIPLGGFSQSVSKDNQLQFRVASMPAKLAIHINKSQWLFLFLDPPDPHRPDSKSPNVITLSHVDNTGRNLETIALQKAIDEAGARNEPTTLFVPAGIYRTGSLWMKSNVTLYLDEGAVILGDEADESYPGHPYPTLPEWAPGADPQMYAALIWFYGVHDAAIRGRGIIDGQGSRRRDLTRSANRPRHRTNLLRAYQSENLTIDGVMLQDSEMWNAVFIRSKKINVTNVKLINEMVYEGWDAGNEKSIWNNSDGIDFDACQDALAEDVLVYTGDDSLVVKATNSGADTPPDVENITFRKCVINNAAKIGTESIAAHMRHITFEEIDSLPMNVNANLVLQPKDVADIEDVSFRHIRMYNNRTWLRAGIYKRVPEQKVFVQIHNLTFEDIDLASTADGTLEGLAGARPIRDVHFINLKSKGHPISSAQQARLKMSLVEDVTTAP